MRPMEGLAARVFFLILDGGSVSPIRPMPVRFDSCGALLLVAVNTCMLSSLYYFNSIRRVVGMQNPFENNDCHCPFYFCRMMFFYTG